MKVYRVAVCFRGLIRTGVHNSKMFHHLFDHPQIQVDYFAHTWDMDNSAPPFLDCLKSETKLWYRLREDTTVELSPSKIKKFTECYKLKYFKIEGMDIYRNLDNRRAKNAVDTDYPMEFHPQYCSAGEVDKLRRKWEWKTKTKYDIVVSTRPDLVLDSTQKESFIKELLSVVDDENCVGIFNLHPNWTLGDPWCDDVMYIGSSKSATVLGKFFDRDLNLTSHQYILKHLVDNGATVKNLPLRYTILREHCSFLDPVMDFKDIFIEDSLYYRDESEFHTLLHQDPTLKKHYEKRVY